MDNFISTIIGLAAGIIIGYLYGTQVADDIYRELVRVKEDLEKLKNLKL